jgi:hypothetical protein
MERKRTTFNKWQGISSPVMLMEFGKAAVLK